MKECDHLRTSTSVFCQKLCMPPINAPTCFLIPIHVEMDPKLNSTEVMGDRERFILTLYSIALVTGTHSNTVNHRIMNHFILNR